jgi:hypothetical protein
MSWLRDRFLRPAAGGTVPARFTADPDLVPVRLSEGAYLGPIGAGTDLGEYFDLGYILDDGISFTADPNAPPVLASTDYGYRGNLVIVTRDGGQNRAAVRLLFGLRVRARHCRTRHERIRAMRTAYHRRHRYSHHR